MYALEIKPELDKLLKKLVKKNKKHFEAIMKKTEEIVTSDPQHYKNLRAPLQDWKRVHIDNRKFVLAFSVNERNKTVTLEDFDHHDNIYSKKRAPKKN